MRRLIIALLLLAAVACYGQTYVIGKARGLATNRVDRAPSGPLSRMQSGPYASALMWQTFNFDDGEAYHDLIAASQDGAKTAGRTNPSFNASGNRVFDGSGTSLTFPATAINAAVSNQYTVATWVKRTSANNVYVVIGGGQDTTVSSPSYRYSGVLIANPTSGSYYIDLETSTGWIRTGLGFGAINTWYHIAGVYNGATVKLYLDGVEMASNNKTGNVVDFDSIVIGADILPGRYFGGNIDDFAIWGSALTESEITEMINLTANDKKWWGASIVWKSITSYELDGLTTDGTNIFRTWDDYIWKYQEDGTEVTNCSDYTVCKDGYDQLFGGMAYKDGTIFALVGVYSSPFSARVIEINPTTLASTTSHVITNLTLSANLIQWRSPYWYIGETATGETGTSRYIHAYDTNWAYVAQCSGTELTYAIGALGWQDGVIRDDVLYANDHQGNVHAFSFLDATTLVEQASELINTAGIGEGITELNGLWYNGQQQNGIVRHKRLKLY